MMTELDKILLPNLKNLMFYDRLIDILINIPETSVYHFSNEYDFLNKTISLSATINSNLIFFINRNRYTYIKINELLLLYDNNTYEFYIVGKFTKPYRLILSRALDIFINHYNFLGHSIEKSSNIYNIMYNGLGFINNPNFDNNIKDVRLDISLTEFINKCVNSINSNDIKTLLDYTTSRFFNNSKKNNIYDLYMSKLFGHVNTTYENKEIILIYDNIKKDVVIYINDVI